MVLGRDGFFEPSDVELAEGLAFATILQAPAIDGTRRPISVPTSCIKPTHPNIRSAPPRVFGFPPRLTRAADSTETFIDAVITKVITEAFFHVNQV